MPQAALAVGPFEAVASRFADGVAASVVFVVGSDVADGLVESDRVVVDPDPFELGGEDGGVGDREQAQLSLQAWGLPVRGGRCRR